MEVQPVKLIDPQKFLLVCLQKIVTLFTGIQVAEKNVNSLLFELLTLNTFPAKFKGLKNSICFLNHADHITS